MMKNFICNDITLEMITTSLKGGYIGILILPDNLTHFNMYEVQCNILPEIYEIVDIEKFFTMSESSNLAQTLLCANDIKVNHICVYKDYLLEKAIYKQSIDKSFSIKLNGTGYLIAVSEAEKNM